MDDDLIADELADTENIDLSGLQQDLSELTDVDTLEFDEFQTIFTSETQAEEAEVAAISEPEISSWVQSLKNFPESVYKNITSRFPTLRQSALENPSIEMTSEELPLLEETNFSESVLGDEGISQQIDVEVPEPEPTVEYEIDYSQEVDLDEILDDAFSGEPPEVLGNAEAEVAEGELVDVSGMTDAEFEAALDSALEEAFGEASAEIGAELSAETAEVAGQTVMEVLEIEAGEAAGLFAAEAASGTVLASVAGAAAVFAPYLAPAIAVAMLAYSIYDIVGIFERESEIEEENQAKIDSLARKAAIKGASYNTIADYEQALDAYYRAPNAYIQYSGPTVTGVDGPSMLSGQAIKVDDLIPVLDKFLTKLAEKVKFYNDFNTIYVKWVMNQNPDEPDVTYREMPTPSLFRLLESKGDTIKSKMDNYLAQFSLEGTKLFTVDSKIIDHWREQVMADKAYDNSNWSEYYTKNERKFKQIDTIMISRKKAEWKNIDKTLLPYVTKVETLRKFLNRTMQCYAVVFDTYFQSMEEEFTGDRFKRNMNKIGWCKDESVLLKIDNKLPEQYKYQHYTRKPSMYNGSWTEQNRIIWEKMALKAAYDFVVETSANIAIELDKQGRRTSKREERFADKLLWGSLPSSLAYWAWVWSAKAYNDLTDNFADLLFEGYNPYDGFSIEDKPEGGVFDFQTTKEEQITYKGTKDEIGDFHLSFTTAYSQKQDVLYVAFRGTDFDNTWTNFLANLEIDGLLTIEKMNGISNYEWHLHGGFLNGFRLLKRQLLARLQELSIKYNPSQTIFTGHSLGSALAQIAMLDVHTSVYATGFLGFGTPRVHYNGEEGREIYKRYWGDHSWRINHLDDLVSWIPLPQGGASTLGNGIMVNRNTEKYARFDGDYRFGKDKWKYAKEMFRIASRLEFLAGHSRAAYFNTMNNTQLLRPPGIRKIKKQGELLDPTTLQYVYTRTCAYHAFIMDTKITKPDFVNNILKFFNDFSMIDLDANGNISREEWIKHKQRLTRGRRLPEGVPDFSSIDKNGDDTISFKEYVEAGLRKFQPEIDVIPEPQPGPSIPTKFGSLPITGLVILPNRVTTSFIEGLVIL